MNSKTVDLILKLNFDFYENFGDSFSEKRNYYWKGWEKALKHINILLSEKNTIKVLDLGCGNGRFYGFLDKNLEKNKFEYIGCDVSEKLLNIAKQKYPNGNFINLDILKDLNNIKDSYDVIVAFGITHHIPSYNIRKKLFSNLISFLNNDGLIIITFWEFNKDKRFETAKRNLHTKYINISEKDIEKGDCFLGWNNKENIYRYVHLYCKKEYKDIIHIMKNNKLSLINEFYSDGKSNNLNYYLIFKKNS